MLTVEDGRSLVDAESYLAVADADTYHANHGNTAWAALTTPQKEVALRNATQALDLMFHTRWLERRVAQGQALDWPRYNIVDRDGFVIGSNVIPNGIKAATALLALAEGTGEDVLPDQDTPGIIGSESNTVGPITTSVTYLGGRLQQKAYVKVERLVIQFLQTGGEIYRS